MATSLETRGGAWAGSRRRSARRRAPSPRRLADPPSSCSVPGQASPGPRGGVGGGRLPLLLGLQVVPHPLPSATQLPGSPPSPATHTHTRPRAHTHAHTHSHASRLLAAQWTDFPGFPEPSLARDEKLQNGPSRQCARAGHAQRGPADFIAYQLRVPEKGEHLHHSQVRQPGGAPNVHVPRGIPVSVGLCLSALGYLGPVVCWGDRQKRVFGLLGNCVVLSLPFLLLPSFSTLFF